MVWRSVCVACAGYLRCACWCGCFHVGGLSAFLPVELVPALGGCLCAVCAVVCGSGGRGRCAGRLVGVVGCGCARGRVLGGQLVLSEGAWLVYAPCGWCGCGCLGLGAGCGCVVCAVWSGVMVGSLTCVAGWWRVWSGRCGLGGGGGCGWTAWWLCAVSAGGPDDGPWVCGGGWACMVVVMVCHCGWCWVWYRWACGLR